VAAGLAAWRLQGGCRGPALVSNGLSDPDDEMRGPGTSALRPHDVLEPPLELRALETRRALPDVLGEIGGALFAELTVKVVLDLM